MRLFSGGTPICKRNLEIQTEKVIVCFLFCFCLGFVFFFFSPAQHAGS